MVDTINTLYDASVQVGRTLTIDCSRFVFELIGCLDDDEGRAGQ